MKEHVLLTIRDLDGEIARLAAVRDGLRILRGAEMPAEAGVPRDAADKPAARRARARPAAAGRGERRRLRGSPVGTRTAALIEAATKLAEPITPDALAKAAGLKDQEGSGKTLCLWAAKGWVRRVGRGRYERTVKFPGLNRPPERKADQCAEAEEDAASVGQKLRKAEEDLQSARYHGRGTLADILEDKVGGLKRRLAELTE